jgi:protease-4
MAGDADATAVELNPGQLALAPATSWALIGDFWSQDALRPGRGTALMLGLPILGSQLALGGQWLSPPSALGGTGSYGKFQLGYGFRLGRGAGLGATWDHLLGTRYGGHDSFTIGLGWRLLPVAAIGLAARDVNHPRPAQDEARVPRSWDGELAVRPLGTDHLEVAGGVRLVEKDDHPWRPHGRVTARLLPGLALFAQMNSYRDDRLRFDESGAVAPGRWIWQGVAGLQADFDRSGIVAGGTGSFGEGVDGPAAGASIMLRGLPARRPPLASGRHIERVKLRGLGDDEAFVRMVVHLRNLGDDTTVGAVLLDIDDLSLGLARVQELRAVVAGLRARVPVVARVTQPGTHEYYLASVCDRVLIHPAGSLMLSGLSQTVTFYRAALDDLGVNVDLVRIAEYKGAMEPFVMNEQSEPVAANRNEVLDDDFGRLVSDLARGRGKKLDEAGVRSVFEQAVLSPEEAERGGLVDGFAADDRDLDVALEQALGRRLPLLESQGPRDRGRWVPSRVAIVDVDGPITDGPEQGLPFSLGAVAWVDRIVEALDLVRADGSVRALVLRVNSPGGSAFGSDRIARAVARVREAGKPVIASMGDLAASGGYYVSAPADQIFALPGTLTGSIGIFAFKVDGQALVAKLGITAETWKRGEHADLFSIFRPWSDDERTIVERHIRSMYGKFLDVVAAGRKSRGITVARADELGRGRIYTGAQALVVGLVDRLGGLDEAMAEAARRGGVPLGPGGLPEIVLLPRRPTNPLASLLGLPGAAATPVLPPGLRLLLPVLLGRTSGVEARLPYDVVRR